MNIIQALKTIENIKNQYPHCDSIYINLKPLIINTKSYFHQFIYSTKDDSISFIEIFPNKQYTYLRFHQGLIDFLIKYKIYNIFVLDKKLMYLIAKYYTEKDLACLIIKRYYKKYRYNLFRKRMDPLKRDLMAYLYHPSRLTFDSDDLSVI